MTDKWKIGFDRILGNEKFSIENWQLVEIKQVLGGIASDFEFVKIELTDKWKLVSVEF